MGSNSFKRHNPYDRHSRPAPLSRVVCVFWALSRQTHYPPASRSRLPGSHPPASGVQCPVSRVPMASALPASCVGLPASGGSPALDDARLHPVPRFPNAVGSLSRCVGRQWLSVSSFGLRASGVSVSPQRASGGSRRGFYSTDNCPSETVSDTLVPGTVASNRMQ